jgi:hypothetical protein
MDWFIIKRGASLTFGKEIVSMGKQICSLVLFCSSLATGTAFAAPCPNLAGSNWDFTLHCVGIDPTTNAPFFGPRTLQGVITQQDSCAFVGTLFNSNDWVGVLSGPGGDTVNFNWDGATGTGEVSANQKQMTFTYTLTGSGLVPTTACTGIGIKQ